MQKTAILVLVFAIVSCMTNKNVKSSNKNSLSRIVIVGAYNEEDVNKPIRERLDHIRWCYEQELKESPSFAGAISIKFIIADSGVVKDAVVYKSNMKIDAFEKCMVNQMKKLVFPAPSDGSVEIVYPFSFAHSQ